MKGDSFGDIPVSNLCAPPEGAAKAKIGELPVAPKPSPTAPKGDVSFTYMWHATNEPVAVYNAVRHSAGPEARATRPWVD